MVTRFPNHWWASSCPTTRATHWRDEEQEFLGSMSNAVSLCRRERQNSAGWDQSPRGIKITTQRRWNYLSKLKSEEKKTPPKKSPPKKKPTRCVKFSAREIPGVSSAGKLWSRNSFLACTKCQKNHPQKPQAGGGKFILYLWKCSPTSILGTSTPSALPSRLPQHSQRNSASSKRC